MPLQKNSPSPPPPFFFFLSQTGDIMVCVTYHRKGNTMSAVVNMWFRISFSTSITKTVCNKLIYTTLDDVQQLFTFLKMLLPSKTLGRFIFLILFSIYYLFFQGWGIFLCFTPTMFFFLFLKKFKQFFFFPRFVHECIRLRLFLFLSLPCSCLAYSCL